MRRESATWDTYVMGACGGDPHALAASAYERGPDANAGPQTPITSTVPRTLPADHSPMRISIVTSIARVEDAGGRERRAVVEALEHARLDRPSSEP